MNPSKVTFMDTITFLRDDILSMVLFLSGVIAKRHNTTDERLGLYQFQVQPILQAMEYRHPVAQSHRVDKKVVFINQVVFHQIRNKVASAISDDVFSRLVL